MMEFNYEGVNADDLRGDTLADLLINVEADFRITDGRDVIYAETAFPVAELARELSRWLNNGGEPDADFRFDSMSFDVVGSVEVLRGVGGWSVRSVFSPDRGSVPMNWVDLAAVLRDFIGKVLRDVERLGLPTLGIIT